MSYGDQIPQSAEEEHRLGLHREPDELCSICASDSAFASLRAELAASESLVTALNEHIKCLVEGATRRIAEAREETRELCARRFAHMTSHPPGTWSMSDYIRATPLDSTPLAARIAELEQVVKARDAGCNHMEAKRQAAESALAAEVERHQATAKALEKLLERAASGETIMEDEARAALTSLPAGPREDR